MSEEKVENSEAEKSLEIPETEAPPVEAIVTGEADPGNPETRAKIADPDFPAENPEKISAPEKIGSSEWVERAKGRRRGRPSKNPAPKKSAAEKSLENPSENPVEAPKKSAAMEKKIRATKAAGIVSVAELGFLFLAERCEVSKEKMAFRPEEKSALTDAIEPLVSVEEDPWANLMMVALAVGGPRAAQIAEGRRAQVARMTAEAPCIDGGGEKCEAA